MAVKYLAGERLVGTAAERAALTTGTGDWITDFSSGTGWTHAGSNAITSNKLQWEIEPNDESYYDIQTEIGENVSDTSWLLRFRFAITLVDVGNDTDFGFLGLSSQNAATNVNQEFMGFSFNAYYNYNYDAQATTADGSDQLWGNQDEGDSPPSAVIYPEDTWSGGSSTTSGTYDKYWEIIRNGNTVTMNVYPDSTYGTVEATFARTQTGITGLRYFLLSGTTGRAVKNQHMEGSIDDIYFWNGTTTPNTAYPNFSNGTIFEESNTGKHYMFDGTDTWNEMI